MTSQDSIRATAEGMIRNYDGEAMQAAEAIAARMAQDYPSGQKLWLAVAREIRALQPKPG